MSDVGADQTDRSASSPSDPELTPSDPEALADAERAGDQVAVDDALLGVPDEAPRAPEIDEPGPLP